MRREAHLLGLERGADFFLCAQTNNVVFGLEFQDTIIGTVVIGDLLLIPDENLLATEGAS